MGETDLARAAISAIRLAFPNAIAIRVQSGVTKVRGGYMHLAPNGTPDWLIVLPHGRRLWLEVKREGERPNADQVEMHNKLRALGHAVDVVRGVEEAVACVRREMGGCR